MEESDIIVDEYKLCESPLNLNCDTYILCSANEIETKYLYYDFKVCKQHENIFDTLICNPDTTLLDQIKDFCPCFGCVFSNHPWKSDNEDEVLNLKRIKLYPAKRNEKLVFNYTQMCELKLLRRG